MSIKNIITVYEQATNKEIKDGVMWYKRAKRECNKIAKEFGLPIRIVVGVVAALSPNNRWERNLKDARILIEGYNKGEDVNTLSLTAYKAMRAKAVDILNGANRSDTIMDTLRGPKITAFYANIMGIDVVTVDGHARNIFYGERINLTDAKVNVSKKEYVTLADAYKRAAATLGLKGFELQAITWVAWRRIHKIG